MWLVESEDNFTQAHTKRKAVVYIELVGVYERNIRTLEWRYTEQYVHKHSPTMSLSQPTRAHNYLYVSHYPPSDIQILPPVVSAGQSAASFSRSFRGAPLFVYVQPIRYYCYLGLKEGRINTTGDAKY